MSEITEEVLREIREVADQRAAALEYAQRLESGRTALWLSTAEFSLAISSFLAGVAWGREHPTVGQPIRPERGEG